MNILFIIPSLSGGGAERITALIASELSLKHKVYIVKYYDTDTEYSYASNIKTITLGINDAKNGMARIRNTLKRIKKLRDFKKKSKIDVSISMLNSPNFENVYSRRGEKVIISIRNKCSMQLHGPTHLMNQLSSQNADCVVALSKNVMKDQINNFNNPVDNIVTIYNPCDIQRLHQLSRSYVDMKLFNDLREEASVLYITAGRLIEQKGHWHLIRAFKNVLSYDSNARLAIFGEGKLKEYLEAVINANKLQGKVVLFGFDPNPYKYFSKSDVFVFSSLFEGFGNVLLEAMACGLPIISTDCDSGPRELLSPESNLAKLATEMEQVEYGLLTPVCSGTKYSNEELEQAEVELGKAMIILNNDDRRKFYHDKSSERIEDFSTKHIIQQWERLIDEK